MSEKERIKLAEAFEHLEKILWNGNPVCPKCGALDRIYTLAGVKDKIGRKREELPDWEDLRGLAPNATGELSSEAFVRELRDAWL